LKKDDFKVNALLSFESLIGDFYRHASMSKIMTLSPLIRYKFWSGLFKILFVGFFASYFCEGNALIVLLVTMNIIFGWWCYKWKKFISMLSIENVTYINRDK
jgi:hypothetical protein